MRCSAVRFLTLLVCGVLVATGIGWCPENVFGASYTDSSFFWGGPYGTPNGSGNDYMSPAKSQGGVGTCWAFCSVGTSEDWYKITRNDPSNVWCSASLGVNDVVGGTGDISGLSEQTLVNYGFAGGIGGGDPQKALDTIADPTYGLVTRYDLPYTQAGPPCDNWTVENNLPGSLNRRLFLTGNRVTFSGTYTQAAIDQIKQDILAKGPGDLTVNSGGHCVNICGWDNSYDSGNGAFLVKNSGFNWSWVYYNSFYPNQTSGPVSHIDGPAYFNGWLSQATWTGTTSNNWDVTTSNNWSHTGGTWDSAILSKATPGVTNGWLNGETAATFAGSGTITVGANSHISAYGITLAAGSNRTFSGGPLTITGYHNDQSVTGGGINAHASVTFNNAITVGAPSTWTVDTGTTLTLSNTGSLNLHISPLTVEVDGTGIANFNGVVSDVTGNTSVYNGMLTGYTGSLIKTGIGRLTLGAGTNTFSGSMTLNQGTLAFSGSNALKNAALILNGGTVAISGSGTTTLNLGALGGSVSFPMPTTALTFGSNICNTVYSGNLTGPSSATLTKNGAGTMMLTGTNNYSGATTINAGVLGAASAASLGSGALVFGGGNFQYGGAFDISSGRTVTINNNFTLDTNGYSPTIAGAIGSSHNVSLTKIGTGVLTLSGANTYTGATNFNGGSIKASTLGNLGNGGALVFNSGGLTFGTSTLDISTRATKFDILGGTLDLNGYSPTFASAINTQGGAGKLALVNSNATASTLMLTAASTISGGVDINGLTLTVANAAGALSTGAGANTITINNGGMINSGAKLLLDDSSGGASPITRIPGATGVTVNAGELWMKGSMTLNGSSADTQNLSDLNVAGPATITVQPSNFRTAALSVANDITMDRTIGSSVLIRGLNLGSSSPTPHAKLARTSGTITRSGTGTGQQIGILPYATGDTTNAGGGTGLVTYDALYGVRPLNTATECISNNVNGATPSNILLTSNTSGSSTGNYHQLSLTLNGGASPVTLSVGTGTLTLDSAAIMNAGSVTNTISGGTLMFNHNNATQSGLGPTVGEGFIHTAANSSLTISSTITNLGTTMFYNMEVTKDGPGTLTLSGNNAYSGSTFLNAGTLVLASPTLSAGSSSLTLNGGTLATSGSSVTARAIGAGLGPHAISPAGAGAIGTLNCSALTVNSNSTLNFDINTSTPAWDEIDTTGALNFATGDTGKAKIVINKTAGSWTQGNTYDLIDFASTTVDPITEFSLIGAPANSYLEFNNPTTPTQLWLYVGSSGAGPQLQGVPEPSTFALLGSGLIGLLVYGWRKRRPTA